MQPKTVRSRSNATVPPQSGSAHGRARTASPEGRGQPVGAEDYSPATLVKLSEEHTAQLRCAFDLFDTNGTGRLRVGEVRVALNALGYAVDSNDLTRLLREAKVNTDCPDSRRDSSGEPTMDFNDFHCVIQRKMTERETRVESVRAFKQMDKDDKGFISLEDLREIADSLRMDLTDDELMEMLLFAQSTSTGGGGAGGGAQGEFGAKETPGVSEDQFLKLMKRANVF